MTKEQMEQFKKEMLCIQELFYAGGINSDQVAEQVNNCFIKHKIEIPSNDTFGHIEFKGKYIVSYHQLVREE